LLLSSDQVILDRYIICDPKPSHTSRHRPSKKEDANHFDCPHIPIIPFSLRIRFFVPSVRSILNAPRILISRYMTRKGGETTLGSMSQKGAGSTLVISVGGQPMHDRRVNIVTLSPNRTASQLFINPPCRDKWSIYWR
jgi:hypothetical protein